MVGARPSYVWRSIIHGRELLKEGLINKVGDGRNTKVWLDNWIMDTVPRHSQYWHDAVVDLTITVSDILDHHSRSWNVNLVRHLFADGDVELILNIKIFPSQSDSIVWGFSESEDMTPRVVTKF